MKNNTNNSNRKIITCKSIEELDEQNQLTKDNKYQKFELIIPKEIAKKYFNTQDGKFETLWKGKIYLTYKKGILSSYQFRKGLDY